MDENSAEEEDQQPNGNTLENVDCVESLPVGQAGPVADIRVRIFGEVKAVSKDPDLGDPPQLPSKRGPEASKILYLALAGSNEHPS